MPTTFNRSIRVAVPALLAVAMVVTPQGCTDLAESPFSVITPDVFYRNDDEVRAGLAAVYSQLNTASTGNYRYLSQIPADDEVIPVRGQDWFDNGAHLEAQRHTWQPGSPLALGTINSAWTQSFTGIARANVLLDAIKDLPLSNKPRTLAEARVLRAYFYYNLMDLFGGLPIVTDAEVAPRERATRAATFAFIEKELTEARNDLPVTWPATDYGRATKGWVDAMLASLYVNAEVFTGTVTANGLQKGQPQWLKAIDAADRLLSGTTYRLTADQAANFRADNNTSPEIVMVSARRPEAGLSLNFISQSLHYNQFAPSPNNGWSVEPPTYRKFDPDDKRRATILEGPQFNIVTAAPVNDRAGARLNFTIDIPDITQATEGNGTRMYKWPFDPARTGTNHGNDYGIYRLAEIYLIKAEALNELGRPAEAIALVNLVRARAFTPPKPLATSLTQAQARQAIFDDRQIELIDEGKRRPDQIRQGTWLPAGWNKPNDAPFSVLMPIPQSQIDANPLLVQNPGY
ncbi:MAG: RagB/SusD family nutrient uptake outer membrane protein [Gemmatimonadaceae bacterium]